MKEITVAVIDGGGRGSVLVEKYSQSPQVDRLLAIPGNDWIKFKTTTKQVKTFPNVKTSDTEAVIKICRDENATLVDVAQDNALASGLVDTLTREGILAVGPDKIAAEIEWDKVFTRELLERLSIPQPVFKSFNSEKEGIKFIVENNEKPYFIKAAGLCEGKGAIAAKNKKDAIDAILKMQKFGTAGKTFLVEEWLKNDDGTKGIEFSAFTITDGKDFKMIGTAKDHKEVNNFGSGNNTGGMGVISPHPFLNVDMQGKIEEIFDKTLTGLRKLRRVYRGILYLGGMVVSKKGVPAPYVIEFNARWGDPEAQGLIPGLLGDFYDTGILSIGSGIKDLEVTTDKKTRVVIAGASRGYPGDFSKVKGKEIFGIDEVQKVAGVRVYGAGMKIEDGRYFALGGRLFYIVGEGSNIQEARAKAYKAIKMVSIKNNGLHYRTDIGLPLH